MKLPSVESDHQSIHRRQNMGFSDWQQLEGELNVHSRYNESVSGIYEMVEKRKKTDYESTFLNGLKSVEMHLKLHYFLSRIHTKCVFVCMHLSGRDEAQNNFREQGNKIYLRLRAIFIQPCFSTNLHNQSSVRLGDAWACRLCSSSRFGWNAKRQGRAKQKPETA